MRDGPDEDPTCMKHHILDNRRSQAVCFQPKLAEFEVSVCSHWSVEVFDPSSVTLTRSNLWKPHVAFGDLAIKKEALRCSQRCCTKGVKGKTSIDGMWGRNTGFILSLSGSLSCQSHLRPDQ